MRKLETNDWILLNSIIYKILIMENMTQMRTQLLEQLRMLVDFDSADFYLAPADGEFKLTSPMFYNCKEDLSEVYDGIDYSRGILYSGKTIIYRETDIMPDEKRAETGYYKKVYKPNNWHYSLQMIMAREKEFVGVITLYRTLGKENYEISSELTITENTLKKHILNIYRKLGIKNRVQMFKLIKEKE